MNVHDSEKMLGVLEKEGYIATDNLVKADLIIFNTCSIRQKAEQKFYSDLGRIKSYKKKDKKLKIAVAGCIAQQEGRNIFRKAPHVDFVFGPQNIHILKELVSGCSAPVILEENPEIASNDLPVKRGDGLKAWVTIMYGCNNFCSYCIVPYTRGRERSRPSGKILSEVKELADIGYKEITLLGQNVNSYKSDVDFPGLLKMLNRVGGIERIRFVTSHPKDLSEGLIYAISGLEKVCEHIHLPLQSGSSAVLKMMNRGYSYADYLEKVSRLREKITGISITSDIIAGFPGETVDNHYQTLTALKEIKFDGVFAFKFSPRPGTRASEIADNLSEQERSERLNEILKVQEGITSGINKSLAGTIQEILVEGESKTDKGKITGRTRTNKIVNLQKTTIKHGSLLAVKITGGKQHSLDGKPVNL